MKRETTTDDLGRKDASHICNRTACRKPGATWWNPSTRAYYCRSCAVKINRHNPGLCLPPAAPAAPSEASEPGLMKLLEGARDHLYDLKGGWHWKKDEPRCGNDAQYVALEQLIDDISKVLIAPPSEPAPAAERAVQVAKDSIAVSDKAILELQAARRVVLPAPAAEPAANKTTQSGTDVGIAGREGGISEQLQSLWDSYLSQFATRPDVPPAKIFKKVVGDYVNETQHELSRLRTELEQAQRRVAELQNKKCAHDAAREWSTNTTPNFEEQPNAH